MPRNVSSSCLEWFFRVKKNVWRAKKMVGNILEHFCWEQDILRDACSFWLVKLLWQERWETMHVHFVIYVAASVMYIHLNEISKPQWIRWMYVENIHILFVEKWFQLKTNQLHDVFFKPLWNVIINYSLRANNVLNSVGKHLSPNFKI